MKTRFHRNLFHRETIARSGVSLSEVLVSVVIMSIGVVLLSTLLPISILRTAQATQLTQAVFLRNNAEAAIESNLGILSNSQIPFPVNPTSSTTVLAVVDPLGAFLVSPAQTFGGPAVLPSVIPRVSGGPTTLAGAEGLAQLPDSFSLVAQGTVSTAGIAATPPYIAFTNTSVAGLNVRNSGNPQLAAYRLVMFDITGKFAVIEPLKQVIGSNLSWWDPTDTAATGPSLPAGFAPKTARIESVERRFTWLMTVQKRLVSTASIVGTPVDGTSDGIWGNWPWAAEINVAVFFNRSFNPKDELPFGVIQTAGGFDGQPGVAGVDDNNDTFVDTPPEAGWLGSDDNRTITVSFAVGSQPPLKKGGYMLEPSQLRWYRIVNFTPLTPTSVSANVLLDRDIHVPAGTTISQGIFMKGIIEVYSLGVRTGQQ